MTTAPPTMVPLTVAIIAHNEAGWIEAALRSAQPVASQLLVLLDSRTTDQTGALAVALGAEVVEAPFHSFGAQRNRALAHCQTPWLLFLDADEQLSPELQAELIAVLSHDRAYAGYWLPRRNRYWRWWLRGGGWYPDHQLRLLRPAQAHYDEDRMVHEVATLAGPAGYLQGHLLHWNISSWRELRHKQRRYALAEAQTLYRAGVRARPHNLLLQPLREVQRRFWQWHGYRDGLLGLGLALTMGYYELVKYIHLRGLGALEPTSPSA